MFLKTNEIARALRAICGLWEKSTKAYLFQIAREKSCEYVLIVDMKKYEIAYHIRC